MTHRLPARSRPSTFHTPPPGRKPASGSGLKRLRTIPPRLTGRSRSTSSTTRTGTSPRIRASLGRPPPGCSPTSTGTGRSTPMSRWRRPRQTGRTRSRSGPSAPTRRGSRARRRNAHDHATGHGDRDRRGERPGHRLWGLLPGRGDVGRRRADHGRGPRHGPRERQVPGRPDAHPHPDSRRRRAPGRRRLA